MLGKRTKLPLNWTKLGPQDLDVAWIDQRLGQLGIDVRQPDNYRQMRYYLDLLEYEIALTEEFLKES